MAFEDYAQNEIVADCAEGYLTRREALRRLMVLGVGGTAAGVMLAGCSDDGDGSDAAAATSTTFPATTATTAGGAAVPAGPAPLATAPITFAGPAGELKGSWSAAAEPRGGVLIVHENTGLTPHFVSLPGRLAASGYSALAIDLLSRRGGTPAFSDPARATAALSGPDGIPGADLVADLRAGVEQVLHRTLGHRAGIMGFCFGGGMVWSVLAAGEQRLAAAAPFYGPLPPGADFTKARAAVLAVYAENDTRVNDTRPAAADALEAAGLTHEVVVEPGAGHAFFNDTRPDRYHAAAAADAYDRLLRWFGMHLS